ncbi:uncharacterized protein METZ01_LOCUS80645 [marine metagenome]|uniref:Uncharacterized protein n=1 Tax=marine metagenome TaxID=408172 RepID=A0A381UJ96_9ZZZZ
MIWRDSCGHAYTDQAISKGFYIEPVHLQALEWKFPANGSHWISAFRLDG